MINILRFSICVLFQTSSKWLLKKQQQQTGTFNLTKQRASSAGETFTISEENWIQKNYFLQKAFEKKKLESLTSPSKGLHQKEKLSQYQKKIA